MSAPSLDVDALVDATPASRDRVVDLMRAASICVVVAWHWTFSVTHWHDGRLVMPNAIADVPGLWAATWLLQVMPVFFFVGGYANLAGWQATERDGTGAARFVRSRLARLTRPLLPWLACWLAFDLAVQAGGGRSVAEWGLVVLVPLWFLGVYALVILAVPVTARLHAAHRGRVLVALGAGILVADALRLGTDFGGPLPAVVGSGLVWLWCHQLGYFWRDGSLVAAGRARAAAVAAAGLAALVVLTLAGPYSHSMVATRGESGNIRPTTACIAALAAFQMGLVLLAHPALERWLARRRPWRAVVAANGLAMPVFCWHMTALVAFLWLYERAGLPLAEDPSAVWWLSRPLWLAGPGLILAAVLAAPGRWLRRAGQ
jgi:fucose 4-O-acetylase-like acetyltransferase